MTVASGPTAPAATAAEAPAADDATSPPSAARSARAREDRRTGYLLISPTAVHRLRDGGPADPVDGLAGLPARPAAQPAPAPASSATTASTTSRPCSPRRASSTRWSPRSSTPSVGTACAIGLGLVAALALRRPFRGRGLVRACMLLPYVAPVVAATFVWKTMLNPQFGIVNHYGTTLLGWNDPIAFLSSAKPVTPFGIDLHISQAMLTVVLFEAWRSFPFAFLFLTARMQAIPESPGGGGRGRRRAPRPRRFRYIVLPQLLPTIAVLTVLRFIWTFNNFDDIYLLTGGGAGTQVVAVRVYDYLINKANIGAAAAQALGARRDPRGAGHRLPQARSDGRRRSHDHAQGTRLAPARPRAWVSRDAVERRRSASCGRRSSCSCWSSRCSPSTTWWCCRSGPLDAVLQDPGALWPKPGEIDFGTYRDVLASTRRRRPRLPHLHEEQLPGRHRHRAC